MTGHEKTALIIAGSGLAINIVNGYTSSSPTTPGGIFYGQNGYLTGINSKLPSSINVGAALIIGGLVYFAWAKWGK